MKLLLKSFLILVFASLTGCVSQSYYQLFSTKWEDAEVTESRIRFENDDIVLSFDLWSPGGESSFAIFNKTNSNIYIDLSRSHLIINDIANTYYQNRIYTKSTATNSKRETITSSAAAHGSSSTSGYGSSFGNSTFAKSYTSSSYLGSSTTNTSGFSISKGYSVSYEEEKIVCIPGKSAKYFSGFEITGYLYSSCDMYKYPSKKETVEISFTKENSPYVVTNVLSYGYTLDEEDNFHELRNTFWVNKVENFHSESFIEYRTPEVCGKRSMHEKGYFLFSKPDWCFIKYYYEMDGGY